MSKGIRFTDEFKQDAVAQVVERGYATNASPSGKLKPRWWRKPKQKVMCLTLPIATSPRGRNKWQT